MRELSLHILDVLENALAAGATMVEVSIDEDLAADRLTIVVRDNGRGMDPELVRRVLDPFFTTRTTRHVGLGLPLFAAAAQTCDGDLSVDSAPGGGTMVSATFRHSHLDRAPLGDMPGTLLAFLLHGEGGAPRLCYCHRVNSETFELDTEAVQAELGGIPLSYPPVRAWLRDYVSQGEAELPLRAGIGNSRRGRDTSLRSE
jgi:hypothetical protein